MGSAVGEGVGGTVDGVASEGVGGAAGEGGAWESEMGRHVFGYFRLQPEIAKHPCQKLGCLIISFHRSGLGAGEAEARGV